MTWVSWRLQRTETLLAAAILALIVALLLPTGLDMASAYHHDGLAACLGRNPPSSCDLTIEQFTTRFEPLGNLLAWLTLVPGLIGVLLAAPFVLELENGTTRLAWTQSITRRRWITCKLAVIVGTALLAALVLTLAMTWWHAPIVHVHGRMENSVYDSEGIVPFGYTLFALGLALAVGAVWRRTVPAVVVGFVGYFAVRIFFDTWLRQHIVSPLHSTWLASPTRRDPSIGGPDLNHAWVISERNDQLGHGPALMHAVYEPASRFWTLQGVETAFFGGIAVALILFAAWWTHERAA